MLARSALATRALTLFVVALAPRLWVAIALTGEPVWDGHYYDFGAKRIAAGLGYSDDVIVGGIPVWHPWCHYPVGYSGFLGAIYKLFGQGPLVAPVAGAVVGSLLALVTWALAREALSERRALLAGGLVALHPGLILYSPLVMTEPLSALLTLLAFLVFAHEARASRATRGLLIGGAVLGLATLVRPQALLCAPFMGLLAPSAKAPPEKPRSTAPGDSERIQLTKKLWSVIRNTSIALGMTLLVVAPWTARNCKVMDGCALVSTNAGWNLAIGSFPRATGRFETLRSADGCREVTGQVQQDRCWFDYGLAQIRARPWFWLSLVPKKLSYTFDHESFAVEYLREAKPWDWPETRRNTARDTLTFAHRLLVCAAALGVIAFVRRPLRAHLASVPLQGLVVQGLALAVVVVLVYDGALAGTPRVWPLVVLLSIVPWLPLPGRPAFPTALRLSAAYLATTVVTHAIFFGEDRYHVVVAPVLCLFAAAALRKSAAGDAART